MRQGVSLAHLLPCQQEMGGTFASQMKYSEIRWRPRFGTSDILLVIKSAGLIAKPDTKS